LGTSYKPTVIELAYVRKKLNPYIAKNLPIKTNINTHIIKLKEKPCEDIEIAVNPKYVNTNASAMFDIILLTMLDSSLAWKDKLK
jgi:hypothetical protein